MQYDANDSSSVTPITFACSVTNKSDSSPTSTDVHVPTEDKTVSIPKCVHTNSQHLD